MTDIEKELLKEVNELRTNSKALLKKQKKINNISKIKSINIQMIKLGLKQKKVPKPMMKPLTF